MEVRRGRHRMALRISMANLFYQTCAAHSCFKRSARINTPLFDVIDVRYLVTVVTSRLHSLTSGGSIHLQYEHFHEGDAAGNRPATAKERSLVEWLLRHGKPVPNSLEQSESLVVVSKCSCGCPTVCFAQEGEAVAQGAEGYPCRLSGHGKWRRRRSHSLSKRRPSQFTGSLLASWH